MNGETEGGPYGAVSVYDISDTGESFINFGTYNGKNGLSQTFTTEPETLYRVNFDLYPNWFILPYEATLRVSAAGQSADFTATGVAAPSPITRVPFEPFHFYFRSDASGSTTLLFQNASGVLYLDNVSVSVVPEPGTMLLLAVGMTLLVWRRSSREIINKDRVSGGLSECRGTWPQPSGCHLQPPD